MNRLSYLSNVTTLALDPGKCVGCGMCALVCPHSVLAMKDGSIAVEDRDACMECGACEMNCPVGAISVEAGVGCAAAVINAALGRRDSGCCCVIEQKADDPDSTRDCTSRKSGCC
jgi:NAD-dependent dihydropyrimidine dehydrogenase PreA subunit